MDNRMCMGRPPAAANMRLVRQRIPADFWSRPAAIRNQLCDNCTLPMTITKPVSILVLGILAAPSLCADIEPQRSRRAMVVTQSGIASEVGLQILKEGGNAVDAAVASAFALAVVMPAAGNIGGGGFLLLRSADGEALAFDFREVAPSRAGPGMFLREGTYDEKLHHESPLSVGVPGTVAGLHLAWAHKGRLPWKRLLAPAIGLAREGFTVTPGLSLSLKSVLPKMSPFPASVAQFSKTGVPYEPGDTLRQPDLARTLERVADQGPAGFYQGETAEWIVREMQARGGLITREDLRSYRAVERTPLRGSYRGIEVIVMPPPTSGGVVLLQMLNVLEGFPLAESGFGSAATLHLLAETMRRGFADRARYLGDPDFNPDMPVDRLISKDYAESLRDTICRSAATKSSPASFEWLPESDETTHLSVIDGELNAVALTYTLEYSYGSRIVVPGAGFLLNNEMGDFNAAPGLTNEKGLIGTEPNLAAPGKRMLSSMSPTILARDGRVLMVTGSPGGRTIINTVLQTVVNVVDFGMNVREAVDAARIHHQWLSDRIYHERGRFAPEILEALEKMGHSLEPVPHQGVVQAIVRDSDGGFLEGFSDRRDPDGAAAGW
jgi:gamma-glutamyltranspeptidase / glutathione hydrolase